MKAIKIITLVILTIFQTACVSQSDVNQSKVSSLQHDQAHRDAMALHEQAHRDAMNAHAIAALGHPIM